GSAEGSNDDTGPPKLGDKLERPQDAELERILENMSAARSICPGLGIPYGLYRAIRFIFRPRWWPGHRRPQVTLFFIVGVGTVHVAFLKRPARELEHLQIKRVA